MHGWVQYDRSYPHQPRISRSSYTHDLRIHVVLQCEKGSLRNGEKGGCPLAANLVSEEKIVQAVSSCPRQSRGNS